MAIKYRISESGIQKVVEILNNDAVVGVRKFSPKEISVSYSEGIIQINDAFTGNTLYEGEAANFVKSDNSVFAQNAGDAVLAMTELTNNIAIDVRELDGIELVNDAIAPDLSAYAKTTDLTTAVSTLETIISTEITSVEATIASEISTAKSEIQIDLDRIDEDIVVANNKITVVENKVPHIGKQLASVGPFSYFFTTYKSVRCKSSSEITFTTGDTGKVLLEFEGTWEAYGLAQVGGYLSTTSPEDVPLGSTNFYIEDDDPTYVNPDFTFGHYDWLEANIDRGTNRHIPLCNWMNTMSESSEAIDIGIWKLDLSPNTSYTYYLWAFTKVYGSNNNTTISVDKMRIVEYVEQ